MLTMANLKVSPVDSGKPSSPGPSFRPQAGTVPSMPSPPVSAAMVRRARRRATHDRPAAPVGHARRVAAVALALGLPAAAACGSRNEPTLPGPESPTPVLSRTNFTAQANEICRATTKAIVERNDDLLPSKLGGGEDAPRARQETEKLPRPALAHLRNLTPPPEDAATARKAWDTMQAAVDNA